MECFPAWQTLDRAALDSSYNNRAAVSDSAAIVASWEMRSRKLRHDAVATLDIVYGPRPRNRIDILHAQKDMPTIVFFHGGYWQSREKETFTFIAEGPLASGFNIALVGYTLAPDASIGQIVAECRAAVDFLGANAQTCGIACDALWVCGWSAGGHLAAMTLSHPLVRGGLAISGIYDLEPISHTYLNEKLKLDPESVHQNSPLHLLPENSPPLIVAVGECELPGLRAQSVVFADARQRHELPGRFLQIDGTNHFTILERLSDEQGLLNRALREMIETTK